MFYWKNWQLRLLLELQRLAICAHAWKQKRAFGRSVFYLLDVLLKDTELQTLVQPHFAVLPDVFQLSLVVQHLVDDVQDVVHSLGVVCWCRQRVGTTRGQRSLQLVQQGLAILAHLMS